MAALGALAFGEDILKGIGALSGDIREAVTGEKEAGKQREKQLEFDAYNNRLNSDATTRRLAINNEFEENKLRIQTQKELLQADREANRLLAQQEREDRISRENADREERKALIAAKQIEQATQLQQQQLSLASQEAIERARVNAEIVKQNRAYAYENINKIAPRGFYAGYAQREPLHVQESPQFKFSDRQAPPPKEETKNSAIKDAIQAYAAFQVKEEIDEKKELLKAKRKRLEEEATESARIGSPVKESTIVPVKQKETRPPGFSFGRLAKKFDITRRQSGIRVANPNPGTGG